MRCTRLETEDCSLAFTPSSYPIFIYLFWLLLRERSKFHLSILPKLGCMLAGHVGKIAHMGVRYTAKNALCPWPFHTK